MMLWSQMLDEGMPFGSRRIAQSEGGRETIVEHHNAFESACHRWKVLDAGDVLGREFSAAGDLDLMTGYRSQQPLTGRFTDVARLIKVKTFLLRLGEDSPGQRML